MGELRLDKLLLEEVAERLDLRETNRKAVESMLLRTSRHYDIDGNTDVFEGIVNSATGVGKTYVLAALIEYLALADPPAKNFLVVAPGRTIRDKTIRNFTPGDKKSLTAAMRSRPHLITAENFNTPTIAKIIADPTKTKVYVFTVQALTSATGEGRATHKFQELLGTSFYQWLAKLDDLVILADEHHCYRGAGFSKTINELHPEVVVGLTATPDKKDEALVVYRYPLAAAIADRLVKTPVIVGRKDSRNDIRTKLLDGVGLLRKKGAVSLRHCEENGLDPVNPVMLVVAKDIAEAEEFRDVLDSLSFDSGDWINTTLLVHSKLTGEEKEKALADLEAVEDPKSPVRIIISVGMLKEGWDVKNVYVIASMRASVSDVLTEQTLGRGLRLPFGTYTGVEFLDTLEVLAHERYEQLLERRKVLNKSLMDYYTYAETRSLPDGSQTVVTQHEEVDIPVIPEPEDTPDPSVEPNSSPDLDPAPDPVDTPVDPTPTTPIVDIDTRNGQADDVADDEATMIIYEPLQDREPIMIPKVAQVPRPASVSLNDIDLDNYGRFEKLGKALTGEFDNDLKRTKLVGKDAGAGRYEMDVETASETIQATFAFDVPLDTSRDGLVKTIMRTPGVEARRTEVGAAERIVDSVLTGMGDQAGEILSAFLSVCAQRLSAEVTAVLRDLSTSQVTYDEEVVVAPLDKTRQARKRRSAGHADGGFDKHTAFNGWAKHLYSHAWFDTKPEYRAASAVDTAKTVVVWARLHLKDVDITWNAEGRKYNPDLVVIEVIDGQRHGWLVETKQNGQMTAEEVVGKRTGARKWVNVVNSSPDVQGITWHYLLLSEDDVQDAQGSWEFMKGFGK